MLKKYPEKLLFLQALSPAYMKRIFLPLALLSMLACGSDSETLDTIDPNVGTIIGK